MNFKQLIPLLLIVLVNLMSGLVQSTDTKEEHPIQQLFKNARSQARQRTTDRNYIAVNRKSPYICEFGAGCDERLPFRDILD